LRKFLIARIFQDGHGNLGRGELSKYEGLTIELQKKQEREIILSFSDIEKLSGSSLPASARRPQYWANRLNPDRRRGANKAARKGGYSAFLLQGMDKVRLVRD